MNDYLYGAELFFFVGLPFSFLVATLTAVIMAPLIWYINTHEPPNWKWLVKLRNLGSNNNS